VRFVGGVEEKKKWFFFIIFKKEKMDRWGTWECVHTGALSE
jgi:hypothetical protein